MKIQTKRAYDKAEKKDGFRVLADRLWPRGVSKARAKIDLWAKDTAPSNALRKWFHADPVKRYAAFSKRYAAELKKNKAAVAALRAALRGRKQATLVSAVKDLAHSHVPVLLRALR